MTARVRAEIASREGAPRRQAQRSVVGYASPTTLRFSRRLGESVRDADYATWLEGPCGRRSPHLEPNRGLPRGLARMLAFLRRALARC